MQVRTLERSDVRDGFTCGEPSLDLFLERYAWQNQTRHHLGVTYVAVDDKTRRVVGYFTVAAASISSDSQVAIPAGGYAEIPVLRVARLAVDTRVQGVGVGAQLLRAALLIALEESGRIGCAGVMVDARAEATGFYERYGFRPLGVLAGGGAVRPRPVPLFLAINSVRAALAQDDPGA